MKSEPHNGKPKVHVVAVRKGFRDLPELAAHLKKHSSRFDYAKEGAHTFFMLHEGAIRDVAKDAETREAIRALQSAIHPNQHVVFSLDELSHDGHYSNSGYIVSPKSSQSYLKRERTTREDDRIYELFGYKGTKDETMHYDGRAIRHEGRAFPGVDVPGFGRVEARVCMDAIHSHQDPKRLLLVPSSGLRGTSYDSDALLFDNVHGFHFWDKNPHPFGGNWHDTLDAGGLKRTNAHLSQKGIRLHFLGNEIPRLEPLDPREIETRVTF